MAAESLLEFNQVFCEHANQRLYTLRMFDILKGFEIVETKCINCHKIIILEIRTFGGCSKSSKE